MTSINIIKKQHKNLNIMTLEELLNKYPSLEKLPAEDTPEEWEVLDKLHIAFDDVHERLCKNPKTKLSETDLKVLKFWDSDVEDYQEPVLDNDPYYDEIHDDIYIPTAEDLKAEREWEDYKYFFGVIYEKVEEIFMYDEPLNADKVIEDAIDKHGYRELSTKSNKNLKKLLFPELD